MCWIWSTIIGDADYVLLISLVLYANNIETTPSYSLVKFGVHS